MVCTVQPNQCKNSSKFASTLIEFFPTETIFKSKVALLSV